VSGKNVFQGMPPNHGMQPTRNKPRAADAWPFGGG
jgi:hypothetical protein